MLKCFISHSSHDKGRYVDHVFRKLPKLNCIYDAVTFEAGLNPIEEIMRGLDESSLFVILLSESALESDWVRLELKNANDRLKRGDLQRIFPLIIDQNQV